MKSTRLGIPIEELQKLNDKRLLAYYKKIRPKIKSYVNGFYCDCWGELETSNRGGTDEEEKRDLELIADAENYLKTIKELLDTRGHVERKK